MTACHKLSLRLAGFVSDGDARLRKTDYRINFKSNHNADPIKWVSSTYFLPHNLLMLSVPTTIEGHAIFGHQDYMHLIWRVRVQLLSPKRLWDFGGIWTPPGQPSAVRVRVGVAHLDSLRDASHHKMLNAKDLDPHNKQHWVGCLKIFNKATSDALQARINTGETHLLATHAVIVVFTAYLSSWLDRGRAPLAIIEDAALVLAFVMYWRSHVTHAGSGLTLVANFLTRETFLDIVTSCHGCILRFAQFRDNYGGQFKPDGPRITSAFSEYFFQFGRMRQTNSPVVSVMGWARHLDHYLYQQDLEAVSDFKLPASCRGIPHSIERVKFDPPPPGWFPTDEHMLTAISQGIQRAVALLQGCGVRTDLSTQTGFFKRPCKHFPLIDTYVRAGGLVAAAEKEDDPNGASPDCEEVCWHQLLPRRSLILWGGVVCDVVWCGTP